MRTVWGLAACVILAGIPASADNHTGETVLNEAQIETAEKIFRKSCRACHGNKAQGASSYPKLSDLEVDYMIDRLERYREGEKIGPNSILMISHAKKLSDDDIVIIANYVATAFD